MLLPPPDTAYRLTALELVSCPVEPGVLLYSQDLRDLLNTLVTRLSYFNSPCEGKGQG